MRYHMRAIIITCQSIITSLSNMLVSYQNAVQHAHQSSHRCPTCSSLITSLSNMRVLIIMRSPHRCYGRCPLLLQFRCDPAASLQTPLARAGTPAGLHLSLHPLLVYLSLHPLLVYTSPCLTSAKGMTAPPSQCTTFLVVQDFLVVQGF